MDGVRYAVLGIGDRSYDEFCGHAKALDARLAELGANKLLERIECEAHDDEPMSRWADEVTTLVGVDSPAPAVAPGQRTRTAEPFTRARPVAAPLSRNVVLTAPGSAKEVRQFGFDVSEHGVSYSVGDALGVCATNSHDMVTRWLAATGLSADDVIEVDGADVPLGAALASRYDICRITRTCSTSSPSTRRPGC